MSRRRKSKSRKPAKFKGRISPKALRKRIVVSLFGLFFIGVTSWSWNQSDHSLLTWWHYIIMAAMALFGIYLLIIAWLPMMRRVNVSHDPLVEAASGSLFRQVMDKLF